MSYHTLGIGSQFPHIINAVIETPKGHRNKYEYREDEGVIALDRILHSVVVYPGDYGYIPQTRGEDGDHLDILVYTHHPVFPGCVVQVKPLGLIDMEDEKGKDWKIVGVVVGDPNTAQITSLDQLGEQFKKEVQQFFEVYKQLEEKEVRFLGWFDQGKAYEVIRNTHQKYLDEIHPS